MRIRRSHVWARKSWCDTRSLAATSVMLLWRLRCFIMNNSFSISTRRAMVVKPGCFYFVVTCAIYILATLFTLLLDLLFYVDWLCLTNFIKSLRGSWTDWLYVGYYYCNWCQFSVTLVFWHVIEIASVHYVRSHLTSSSSWMMFDFPFFAMHVYVYVKGLNIFKLCIIVDYCSVKHNFIWNFLCVSVSL